MTKTIAKTTREGARVTALTHKAHAWNSRTGEYETITRGFNGRAHVIETKTGYKLLQSYETIVMVIAPNGKCYRTWSDWSATTAKHLAAFCDLYGVDFYHGKTDWMKKPVYICGVNPYPCLSVEYSGAWGNPTGYLEKFQFLGGVEK